MKRKASRQARAIKEKRGFWGGNPEIRADKVNSELVLDCTSHVDDVCVLQNSDTLVHKIELQPRRFTLSLCLIFEHLKELTGKSLKELNLDDYDMLLF